MEVKHSFGREEAELPCNEYKDEDFHGHYC